MFHLLCKYYLSMNILHVAPIGHVAEGIGSVLVRLIPEQQSFENDVRVISIFENNLYKNITIPYVYKVRDFSAYIHSWHPDIVIFHSIFFIPYLKFSKILSNEKIPYLVQLHGGLSLENYKKNRIKKWVALQLSFKDFLKKAKSIIYLNKNEKNNSIVTSYNKGSIIIPNGCDEVYGVCIEKSSVDIVDIVYIGRVDMVHKGNDILIEAMKLLQNEDYNKCKVSVYANPNDPDLSIFKKRIEGMDGLIEYKGGIYGEDKNRRLREADMFILTSRYEGMPMGVLEALSYGIPCIVTPGTNMADEISDAKAGWVSSFDAVQVAQTIKTAVEEYSTDSCQFRVNAHRLSKEYDWERIARDSIQSYHSVLK